MADRQGRKGNEIGRRRELGSRLSKYDGEYGLLQVSSVDDVETCASLTKWARLLSLTKCCRNWRKCLVRFCIFIKGPKIHCSVMDAVLCLTPGI